MESIKQNINWYVYSVLVLNKNVKFMYACIIINTFQDWWEVEWVCLNSAFSGIVIENKSTSFRRNIAQKTK